MKAQNPLISEDFNNNLNKWVIDDNNNRSAEINNGIYRIYHKKDYNSWNFWNKIPNFYPNGDFTIESKLKLVEGDSLSFYSLTWGLKNSYNCHGFSISASGYFKIYTWADSQYVTVKNWEKNASVLKIGYFNKIKVQSIGKSISFFINDSLVHVMPKPILYGSKIGFNLNKKVKLDVDYIKVWQNNEIKLVEDAIQGRIKENLGSGINTKVNEIMPIVSPDGNTLYFVRKKYTGNLGNDKKDDIWVSKSDNNGIWSEAINLGPPINTEGHNFLVYVSPDEQTLIVGNRYRKDGTISGKGLSITRKVADSWSIPIPINIENYFNESKQVSLSFSANRKVMLLSIQHKENYGEKDIYVSFQIDETHYTEPLNLGADINTFLDETTPYLAADGKTLYFSSEGHVGYGSADIFVSRRLDNSWQKWSEPQNLGPEINTKGWDAYYNIPVKGEKAYMVSSDEKLGNTEIIAVEIPRAAKPDPITMLSGRVLHGITRKPLEAEISFYSSPGHLESGLSNSDSKDGFFKMALPSNKTYEAVALRKGYYAATESIDLSNSKKYSEKKFDILLYPLAKDVIIPVSRINFNKKNEPDPDALYETDRLIHLLEQYPKLKIEIQVAARSESDAKNRADEIKKIMSESGISEKRLGVSVKSGKESFAFKVIVDSPTKEQKKEQPKDFDKNIDITKIKTGESFRIENLYFMADSSSFTSNSIIVLNELAEFLIKNPNIVLEIGGHTNGLPSHNYCDRLSSERAEKVRLFLISGGVSSKQLSSMGYGKRQPLADNSTEEGRRLNQRVEVKVLKI